jgi:hypothetical protein
MYSSFSFLTSALDGVSGQRHAPAALYPRYPVDRRLCGGSELVQTQKLGDKSFASVGDLTPVVQSAVTP